jgi:hypothetical protein
MFVPLKTPFYILISNSYVLYSNRIFYFSNLSINYYRVIYEELKIEYLKIETLRSSTNDE